MTDRQLPRVSLRQQIEATRLAETRQRALASGQAVRGLRPQSVEAYDTQRLGAAARTLEWLARHEADIRDYLALTGPQRMQLLASARGITVFDAVSDRLEAGPRQGSLP